MGQPDGCMQAAGAFASALAAAHRHSGQRRAAGRRPGSPIAQRGRSTLQDAHVSQQHRQKVGASGSHRGWRNRVKPRGRCPTSMRTPDHARVFQQPASGRAAFSVACGASVLSRSARIACDKLPTARTAHQLPILPDDGSYCFANSTYMPSSSPRAAHARGGAVGCHCLPPRTALVRGPSSVHPKPLRSAPPSATPLWRPLSLPAAGRWVQRAARGRRTPQCKLWQPVCMPAVAGGRPLWLMSAHGASSRPRGARPAEGGVVRCSSPRGEARYFRPQPAAATACSGKPAIRLKPHR
jgi:hypothetical protein